MAHCSAGVVVSWQELQASFLSPTRSGADWEVEAGATPAVIPPIAATAAIKAVTLLMEEVCDMYNVTLGCDGSCVTEL